MDEPTLVDVFARPTKGSCAEDDVLVATDCDPAKLAKVRAMAAAKGWTITRIIPIGGPLTGFGPDAIRA